MSVLAIGYLCLMVWTWREGISNIIATGVERGIRRSKDEDAS